MTSSSGSPRSEPKSCAAGTSIALTARKVGSAAAENATQQRAIRRSAVVKDDAGASASNVPAAP